jgi:hypothetical protein
MLVLLLSANMVRMETANRTSVTNTSCSVYSVEILLMMDSGLVRNVQSILSNKSEKQCISWAFIIRVDFVKNFVSFIRDI